jgi:hypothetical protein
MGHLLGLTPLQNKVWSLRGPKGLSATETAKKLDTFKQNVHQTFLMAKNTVSNALLEVAEANRLEVRKVDSERGILWGYQRWLGCDVVITYSTKLGVKVWYWNYNSEKVTDKTLLDEARGYLLDLAEERGVVLAEEQKRQHPAKLAKLVFNELVPEMVR